MYKTTRTNCGGHVAVTEPAKKVVSDYYNCPKSIILKKMVFSVHPTNSRRQYSDRLFPISGNP